MRKFLTILSVILLIATQSLAQSTRPVTNTGNEDPIVKIYPNPATNNLMVHLGGFKKLPSQLWVFDATGRMIDQILIHNTNSWFTVNVSGLTNGVYTLLVKDDIGFVVRKRFVKE